MPYNPMPLSGQSLGQTRDQIRNNIQDLKNSLAVDHADLDLAGLTGKHKHSNYYPVLGTDLPTTGAGEVALYNDSTTTGQIWLCPQNQVAANKAVQFTAGDVTDPQFSTNMVYNTTSSSNNKGGWTFLPGNLLLQYGTINWINSGNPLIGTTLFPIPFLAGFVPFSIQLTLQGLPTGTTVSITSASPPTNTSFHWGLTNPLTSATTVINFLAIGRAA